MKKALKQQAIIQQKKEITKGGGTATPTPGDGEFLRGAHDETAKAMMQKCIEIESTLFSVVTIVDIANIDNLEIHRGKDPSVELKCFKHEHSI